LLSSSAQSGPRELRPLTDILAGDFEASYIPIRCAAVFMGMTKWGESQLPEETQTRFLEIAQNLVSVAAQLRTEDTGVDRGTTYDAALSDAVSITEEYLIRFQSNYLANGTAWMSDSSFLSDLDICDQLSGGSQ